MVRAKPSTEPVLTSWQEADGSLRRIGEIGDLLAKGNADLNRKIQQLRQVADERYAGTAKELVRLEKDIEEFSRSRKEAGEFEEKKSKELTFGTVFFRMGQPTLNVRKNETTVAAIKAEFKKEAQDYLHTKETPDKEELKALSNAELKKLGITRIPGKDEFSYELNAEKLREALAQKAETAETAAGKK